MLARRHPLSSLGPRRWLDRGSGHSRSRKVAGHQRFPVYLWHFVGNQCWRAGTALSSSLQDRVQPEIKVVEEQQHPIVIIVVTMTGMPRI